MVYADVILPLPLEGTFTYKVPPSLEQKIGERQRVVVPIGRTKTYLAVVKRLHNDKPNFDCKDILTVIDDKPILLPSQIKLWEWMADYYMATIGDVYRAAMPNGLKKEEGYRSRKETYVTLANDYKNEINLHACLDNLKRARQQYNILITYLSLSHYDELTGNKSNQDIKEISRDELLNVSQATTATLRQLVSKGILTTYEKEVGRLNCNVEADSSELKTLNDKQTVAYNQILNSMEHHNVTLLHGVTSAGKTEIYIHLIQKAIEEGKQVLYLLPEIALTVQIMTRLQRVFGHRLGIYHSKFSDDERVEIWQKQLSEQPYDIILGARSAVFLPFSRLGLVIVDEEHETSFKQQDPAPRYHARSAAIVLAKLTGAKTLLGTATPSIESYYNTTIGKYGLVELFTRYAGIAMPKIDIVDTKDLSKRKMMKGPFSPFLLQLSKQALEEGQQVILFQNRRGYSHIVECKTCGWVPRCENCDVTLTYHRRTNALSCHYCGYTITVPSKCPCCEETEMIQKGYGTERIEAHIQQLLPSARIARMDLDTTRSRNAYERIIADFASGKSNLLIGTQMVSKGLDFDNVAVVGILNADSMTNMPDFRAAEHAFTMISQVSGRAGRKGKQGRVVLQTHEKDLSLFQYIVENDYKAYYRETLDERKMFMYPPFSHVFYIYLRHRNDRFVDAAAHVLASRLRQLFGTRLLGPDRPAVARVKQMHIRKLVLKIENGLSLTIVRSYLRRTASELLAEKQYSSVQIFFDVDPM